MIMKIRTALLAAFVFMAGLPAAAHHSVAGYFDTSKTISFSGVVTKVLWMNPHVVLYVKTTNENGKGETWALQGMAPNGVARLVSRDKFKEGMSVSATGYPARSNAQPGNIHPGIAAADAVTGNVEALELRLANGEVLAFSRYRDSSTK
jgi:hypothetical protein